jgi:di/tricarboxylate transporter
MKDQGRKRIAVAVLGFLGLGLAVAIALALTLLVAAGMPNDPTGPASAPAGQK